MSSCFHILYQTWQTSTFQDGENCPQLTETSRVESRWHLPPLQLFHFFFFTPHRTAINFWPMLMHPLNIWCFFMECWQWNKEMAGTFRWVQCSASIFSTDLCTPSPVSASPPLGTFSKFTEARWSTKTTTLYFPQDSMLDLSFLCLTSPSLCLWLTTWA